MIDSSQGKIFLSFERGHTETDEFRSYNTFNYGNYQYQNKNAFGSLYVLNDDTLAAGKEEKITAEADSIIVLLPIVGAVVFTHNCENNGVVNAGEVMLFSLAANNSVEFSNPFGEGLINYLHIWFKVRSETALLPEIVAFNIDVNKNQMIHLFNNKIVNPRLTISSYIGKFKGREEVSYKLSKAGNGIFVFVVQGAFEVQYRLLEARDGLALWNVNEVEIEALSNDAIILLIELPVTGE